jgi:hypothetical protein
MGEKRTDGCVFGFNVVDHNGGHDESNDLDGESSCSIEV